MQTSPTTESLSQIEILDQLAVTLEALVTALGTYNTIRVQQLQAEVQELRIALAAAPSIVPSRLSREALDRLKSTVTRIRVTEKRVQDVREAQEGLEPLPSPPQREATEEEEKFIAFLEATAQNDFSTFIPYPDVLRTSGGNPLTGYDTPNFHRAALHLTAHAERGRYEEALNLVKKLRWSIDADEMSLRCLSLVFPRVLWDKYYAPIEDGIARPPVLELLIRLYAAESDRDIPTILALLDGGHARGQALWDEVVADEDNPTHEQLSAFYNGRDFPESDCVPGVLRSKIGTAFRLIPVLLAERYGARTAFDYGGGAGLSTAALRAAGCSRVTLIEENRRMLQFAQWRDNEAGIDGITYLPESQLCTDIDTHTKRYDLGVCTEVLEHVIDVEGTIARMAALIRPGGLLFQSTSFGLYPHLSHLKPNLRYSGVEDELMASAGFELIPLEMPIPTLSSQRLYRRR